MDDALRQLITWCDPVPRGGTAELAGNPTSGRRTATVDGAREAALEAVDRTRQRSLADFLE